MTGQEQPTRLAALATCALKPFSQTEAKSVKADLKAMARAEPALQPVLEQAPVLHDFLVAAFSLSPYLRDIAVAHPALLLRVVTEPIGPVIEKTIVEARESWRGPDVTDNMLMERLRRAKRTAAFALALYDLARLTRARDSARLLSQFAAAATSATIDHLLLGAHRQAKIRLGDEDRPSAGSGVIVLGMGKLGADELNYSSDIDLVVFYEPEALGFADILDASDIFARLLRRLVRILQERTGDGYVFRTDLRLRPDPGATPLAIPVEAALIYYEGRGQNWERAAYIKARPVAGDLEAGERFLKALRPFVFRKYLDYAAIADIHSIKRQIHAHKGHGEIAVKGHNVKLGRGGIREIEFFVQTQQLIAGGRAAALRGRETEGMLAALAEASWIDGRTRDELTEAYWFLRDVEHRIQMVRDEQSHTLPSTEAELKRIALMAGFADTGTFADALSRVMHTVERRYVQLFEREAELSSELGNLVFTGQKDDPDTLETIHGLGFERPQDIARVMRTWHNGRYRATQSVEARERLTELTPRLLKVFGESRRADEALLRFDAFLAKLPAGIQLFSLLGNNPALLSLIVTIMSAAPRLADIVAGKPHVFDGMLDRRVLNEMPEREDLARRLEDFLSTARHYEDRLDRLRIFASEQRFLIGIRLLTGVIDGPATGCALTDLAEILVAATFKAVREEIVMAHGEIEGGRVALVAMGKAGSRELTAGSDIDLILIYDHEGDAADSEGPRPLDVARYYARLTQRLIAALSAPTAEGVLYEVDMRLRPSGNKGPVATRLPAFVKYQHEEAWTWEHMALTRARPIAGDRDMMQRTADAIHAVIGEPGDAKVLRKDVREMRALVEAEKPPENSWDFKLIPGGLVDIEFSAQLMFLLASAEGRALPACGLPTGDVLRQLGPGFLPDADLQLMMRSLAVMTDLSQIIRLCIDGPFDPKQAPAGLIERLCRAGDAPDIKVLEAELRRLTKAVRRMFLALASEPA
ncbi:bifunctional [glutamine synthetase] adenylyltransferase/[glutamine synthetase]-adenylyl-L-tyrosine phosphorylase [Rhizobium sp. NFR03]|uniref:bifunctional [glutamine synthetase] adenylyltransferase/[glutamine synthetase]-adenylyl-L-tyrosine phosphorylase n=1 Tax=Rhizobium sp. NFR03 TaxID=1566263 RepID=UPI0008D0F205|nr:bifunctional [glutamine synthetase] adenylyltransferase/[glutamine synthetase]-adenylyl-L-tyrosine phosphorylase [Rhizobium sp. NFR03]SES15478.1 glutamate-ammonia-ligase adenylyltransferase [Rhizobium sp. NFR03]